MALANDFQLTVEIENWRAVGNGTLRGFLDVTIWPLGLTLVSCGICATSSSRWCNPPSRPQLDRDGQKRRDQSGKPLFDKVAYFTSRAGQDAFSRAVIAAMDAAHAGWAQ